MEVLQHIYYVIILLVVTSVSSSRIPHLNHGFADDLRIFLLSSSKDGT